MYKYKGRFYRLVGWSKKGALVQEYTKILWFYKEVKGARFYISDFELKKFEEVGRR